MNPKIFFAIFATMFLAELGDKTQLATLLFAADKQINKLCVFCATAAAMVASTALCVLLGACLAHTMDRRLLSLIAGAGFIIIGAWTIAQALRPAA